MRGGRIEVAAARVLDARVVGHRRRLGAPRNLDPLRRRHLVHVLEVELLVAVELAELLRLRQPGKGIFAGNLRQRDRAIDQPRNALAEKSDDEVLAVRCPIKTRSPTAREPDSFSVSTCPSRTSAENSSPS